MLISSLCRVGISVGLCALLAGCSQANATSGFESAAGLTMRQVAPAKATALPEVVRSGNELGLAMLADAPSGSNAVVSPASFATALAMLTDGAKGATLSELETLLGATGEQRRDAFAALRGSLATFDGDPAVVQKPDLPDQPLVHLADRVVVDEGYPINADYLRALADGFGAGVQRTDLGADQAKQVLSDWVRKHTGGLIKESAIAPDKDLRVVLQDVVLLAARWQTPFSPSGTAPRPFTLADQTKVEVETMASSQP